MTKVLDTVNIVDLAMSATDAKTSEQIQAIGKALGLVKEEKEEEKS